MSVEVWKATPAARPYRFELLPEDAMASALDLLERPVDADAHGPNGGERDAAVERGLEQALAFAAHQSRERQSALVLFHDLLPAGPDERRARVAAFRPRFRSAELCRLLLDQVAEEAHRDASASREFGALALWAAGQIDPETPAAIRADLLAEVWTAISGSRRLGDDLEGAAEALERAESHLAQGSGTLMVRATVLLEKASLESDRDDHAAGLRFVDPALCILRAAAVGSGIARALAVRGRLELGAGRPATARPLFEEARQQLGDHSDPALKLALHQNLAVCLGELGRLGEARLTLRIAHAIAKLLDRPAARWRALFLEGRLARLAGAADAAREALRRARGGFVAAGRPLEAGLVGLELCRYDLEIRRYGRLACDSWLLGPIAGRLLRQGLSGAGLERLLERAALDRSW